MASDSELWRRFRVRPVFDNVVDDVRDESSEAETRLLTPPPCRKRPMGVHGSATAAAAGWVKLDGMRRNRGGREEPPW